VICFNILFVMVVYKLKKSWKVLACNITFWRVLLQNTWTIICNFVVHYGDLCVCTWMWHNRKRHPNTRFSFQRPTLFFLMYFCLSETLNNWVWHIQIKTACMKKLWAHLVWEMPVNIWSSIFCLHVSYPKIERSKFADL